VEVAFCGGVLLSGNNTCVTAKFLSPVAVAVSQTQAILCITVSAEIFISVRGTISKEGTELWSLHSCCAPDFVVCSVGVPCAACAVSDRVEMWIEVCVARTERGSFFLTGIWENSLKSYEGAGYLSGGFNHIRLFLRLNRQFSVC